MNYGGGGEAKEMIFFFLFPSDTQLLAIYNYHYNCNFASGYDQSVSISDTSFTSTSLSGIP